MTIHTVYIVGISCSLKPQQWVTLLTWQWSRRQSLTPFTKRESHRGSLLKEVAVQGVLYQSILNAKLIGRKKLGRKMCTTGMTASLRILSSKADSNTQESFTSSELKLEWMHQESPRSDIFRKRATKPLLEHKQSQKYLTWAKEKRTGLLLNGPKSSLKPPLHLEVKVPESGGRVERHRIHVAWSPVWSFHSQWWFGLSCHLLVLVHCVFWSPQSMQPSTRKF